MSRIRFQSKANGLLTLRGKWMKAIVIMLLMALLVFGFNEIDLAYRTATNTPEFLTDGSLNLSAASFVIEAVVTLLLLLFVPPLFTGQADWYWALSGTQNKSIGDVFGWFGSFRLYSKSVWLAFNLFIRYLFWTILTCGVPVGMVAAAWYFFPPNFTALAAGDTSATLDYNTTVFVMLSGIASTLLIFALVLLCYILMRYFLAVFLLVEDSNRSVKEVIRTSRAYSKGKRGEMTVFVFSFVLWFVSLLLWFPALFVVPYFNASASVYAKHLIYTGRAAEKKPDVSVPAGEEGEKTKDA